METPTSITPILQHSNTPRSSTPRLIGYFALLSLAASLASPQGSLASIPIAFFLKDSLHLNTEQQAQFQFIIHIPIYGAFLFGLLRDRWSPLGKRDRGYFLLFAPLVALAYVSLSFANQSYAQLLVGVFAATLVFRIMAPAISALFAAVGQDKLMTGRLSTVNHILGYVLSAALFRASGLLHNLSAQALFLVLAACTSGIFLLGVYEPKTVAKSADAPKRAHRDFFADFLKLFSHRAIWPAVLIYLTWEFAPSTGTALLNHLTNTVHMNRDEYSSYRSIVTLSLIPGALLYGFLCTRVDTRKLLWWSVALGVPQALPLIFIHTPATAYMAAVWYGFVGGMASTAIYDVFLRSVPKGFEGFAVALGVTGVALSDQLGNLWGASLYQQGGFALTNWVTIGVYACILPMLLLVPRWVTAMPDAA